MTAVTKLALGLLAATTVAADSRLNLRFSPLLISSLVAATADAAYLRKAGQSRDSASTASGILVPSCTTSTPKITATLR